MKINLGSSVLIRGGDGRKGNLVDIVLSTDGQDGSLIAICFVKFADNDQWWSGGSHWLIADPDGVHLVFEMQEHLRRLMLNLHIDTGKPLKESGHGRTTHSTQECEATG